MGLKFRRNHFVICAFVTTSILLTVLLQTKSPKNIKNMKYVLIWTDPAAEPLSAFGTGTETFVRRNCFVQNCYVTGDRKFFNDNSTFDAILFHGPEVFDQIPEDYFPKERSAHESYIFTSTESSDKYNVLDNQLDGVFNFSWTYKLNSNISFTYMVIKNREGKLIGPKAKIDWISIDKMLPVNDAITSKLANKRIAAAWFLSNCRSTSKRKLIADTIAKELSKYNLTLHLYGACDYKYFSRNFLEQCLQRNYYFYFAFENSLSEDYVSEGLLYALQNYAVPIVYGGADYNRFMPDGIYLNTAAMSVATLVKRMAEIINNKQLYYEFFKWHNHYSYHHPEETADTDPYCSLCSFINNINYSTVSTIGNFKKWWIENPIIP